MQYRHYKGGIYELVGEASLAPDLTPMIVYRDEAGALWVRPKSVFLELIDIDGTMIPRFAPLA